jgi:orotidine-5'-phosphate decarboxylase
MHFTDNLANRIKATSPIILGLDPNIDLFVDEFKPKNLSEVEDSLVYFCETVINASLDLICAVKIQIAYFESYGLAGMKALARVVKILKDKNLLIIMDAKRADIGSTNEAYSKAYLLPDKFSDESFVSDSLIVNPFLGYDSLEVFMNVAKKTNKGLFILTKTSNPGSSTIQDLVVENQTISEKIASLIYSYNQETLGSNGYGLFGAVVGATFFETALKLRKIMPNTWFLMPGVGHQQADISFNISQLQNSDKLGVLIPISRAILYPTRELLQKFDYSKAVNFLLSKYIKDFT